MNEIAVREKIPALTVGKFIATPVGLQLSGIPSMEEWLEFAELLRRVEGSVQWLIGDSLTQCEFQYGETSSQMTALWPEYQYHTLLQLRRICENVNYCRRRQNLSVEHHKEIAALPSEEQEYWLEQADDPDPDKRWAVKKLRLEIKKHSQLAKAEERKRLISEYGEFVWTGDFRQAGRQIADKSIDMILTDPPYDEDSVSLFGDLSEFADRVLRPSGLCVAYAGHYFLPRYFLELGKSLEYLWTGAIRHTGGESRFRKYHIRVGWKPVLIFGKQPIDKWWDWWTDSPHALEMISGGKEKDDHKWQQSVGEAGYYLKHLCPEGGVIVDPMCGSGTTLVAAKSLGLQYIGIEIDEYTALTAMKRLAEESMAFL